ncbi:MAG: carboxypeptidase regulatory-like domain-containing protein [Gemmatimonadota bacterium]|nr:MAG: carboxypeptidase regulatory-like domain-containing protein [Gemmatimonadota bacterium]
MSRGCSLLPWPCPPPQAFRSSQQCARTAVLVAILCVNGLIAPRASAQVATVLGRVLDAESGRPIEAVAVRLLREETDLIRTTDDEGAFHFPRVPPGVYELVLEHVAYGSFSDSLDVGAGEFLSLEVRLAMQPIELEPLVVTVRRRHTSAKMAGFYERMEKGLGYFITWEDIERRRPLRISHMIGELPGARLIPVSALRCRIVFRGRVRYDPTSKRIEPCWPAVYLDGRPVYSLSESSDATIDDFVMPNDVEAVEVYHGPAVLPPRFAFHNAHCGAIIVWTRSGPL